MDSSTRSTLLATFVPRLRELHSLYANLEKNYARLPLASRRYLYGKNMDPSSGGALGVRTLAELKFVLAATLQWSPSSHSYNVHMFDAARGAVGDRGSGGSGWDELCPILLGWFDEMVQADHLVGKLVQDPNASVGLQGVHELLLTAEHKYEWLKTVYSEVWRRGEFARQPNEMTSLFSNSWTTAGPGDVQPQEWMVYLGWNRFCFKIANGITPDQIIAEIKGYGPRSPSSSATVEEMNAVHHGQGGKREFFATSMPASWQPWVRHGDTFFGGMLQVSPSRVMIESFGNHPACADTSPCRWPADFCPCKVRGGACSSGNCRASGPWNWPCVPAERQVESVGWPSYPPGYLSVEEAAAAGELDLNIVYAEPKEITDPLPPAPTAILTAYNAHWARLSQMDPNIAFPTPTYELDDLLERGGLGLPADVTSSLSDQRLVELKTKSFFLSGFGIPYDIGPDIRRGAVVVPKFAEYDTTRPRVLLDQLKMEREKWMPDLLIQRTGQQGYFEYALGSDFVVVAIREAVRELIAICENKLASIAAGC